MEPRTTKRTTRYRRHRQGLTKKYGSLCWICGAEGADTIDHVIPYSRGGSNHRVNLMPAHRSCNSRRNAHGNSPLNINSTPTLTDLLTGRITVMQGEGRAVPLEVRNFRDGHHLYTAAVKAAQTSKETTHA